MKNVGCANYMANFLLASVQIEGLRGWMGGWVSQNLHIVQIKKTYAKMDDP